MRCVSRILGNAIFSSTKAAVDKAQAGPKKDTPQKHVQAVEKAHTDKSHSKAYKELDVANKALADVFRLT